MTVEPATPDRSTARHDLRRWNRWFQPLVVVAAILPLGPIIAGGNPSTAPAAWLAVTCWLVLLALARLGWIAVLVAAAADSMRGVGRLARRLGLAGLYAAAAVYGSARCRRRSSWCRRRA